MSFPTHWAPVFLGDLCDERGETVNPAKAPHQQFELYSVPSHSDGSPEIVLGSSIGSNKQAVAARSVLLCKINPRINRVWIVGNFTNHTKIASTEWIIFPESDEVLPEFLRYFLQQHCVRKFLAHNASGVGGSLMRVKSSTLRDFPFALPPLDEQRRVVAKIEELFSELDKGIENLKMAGVQLAVLRQALLKYAFEGKLTAQWRETHADQLESADQLLARIHADREEVYCQHLARWAAAFKEWENRDRTSKRPVKPRKPEEPEKPSSEHLKRIWSLPNTWQWLQIGSFAFVTKLAGFEYTDYVQYNDEGDLHVIKAENAGRNGFRATKYSRIFSKSVENLKRSFLNGGELLVVFVGAGTGNVATVPSGTPFFLGPNIGMARPESDAVLTRYVELFLRSPGGRDMILAAAKAVAQPSLSMETIRQAPVAIPTTLEQQEIVKLLEQNLDGIETLESDIDQNLQKAEAMRQSILKKAFAGELVPQDPNDEPASELLARIRAERAEKLAGKIRSTRDSSIRKPSVRSVRVKSS